MPAAQQTLSVYDDNTQSCFQIGLEDYLVGVVAGEMPASFESEALKAQAVAARTYTLRRLKSPCGRGGAHICTDSSCCQAYKKDAALKESWAENYNAYLNRIRGAVSSTAGEAIYYEGELIEALYHSSAGGMTEDAQHVFSHARPYLVGVASPGEESSAQYISNIRLTRKAFAKTVNAKWKKAKLKAAALQKQVEIVSRYESGRVESIRLGGVTVSGRDLRKLLSLNSANFDFSLSKDAILFNTCGYGHGVGMSQYGANAMAKNGKSYKDILLYYYTGVEIK